MRASFDSCLRTSTFRANLLRILGIGALSLHLAAAEDDCTIHIIVSEGEGEGEGEGERDSDGDGLLDRKPRSAPTRTTPTPTATACRTAKRCGATVRCC
jgi:hypothetical protein